MSTKHLVPKRRLRSSLHTGFLENYFWQVPSFEYCGVGELHTRSRLWRTMADLGLS